MKVISMTGVWYLAMALVVLLGANTLTAWDVLPGLVLAGVLWLLFALGFKRRARGATVTVDDAQLDDIIARLLPVLAAASVLSAIYIARFYTGQSVESVISTLQEGTSAYRSYQDHFAEQSLGAFSPQKIPAILAGAMMKFTLIALHMRVLVVERRPSPKHIVALSAVSIAYLYFSFSRGTSFEVFELFALVWFAMAMRRRVHPDIRTSVASRVAVVTGGVLLLFVFQYNLDARMGFEYARDCLTSEICRDPNSILYSVFPFLGDLSFRMTTYAGFGVYFSSNFITGPLLSTPELLIAAGVPLGFALYGADPSGQVCSNVIDCGAAWTPDMIVYAQTFGFLGLFMLVFLAGRLARRLDRSLDCGSGTLTLMLLFFVFLQVISLPVGNFVTVSSSNQLSFLGVVVLYAYTRARSSRRMARGPTPLLADRSVL